LGFHALTGKSAFFRSSAVSSAQAESCETFTSGQNVIASGSGDFCGTAKAFTRTRNGTLTGGAFVADTVSVPS